MAPSEVDDILFRWEIGQEKGFKYLDPNLFGIEWVVVVKVTEELYEVITERSSTKAGPFDKEAMQKLLGSNKLELYSGGYGLNFRYKKSNGCECGSWATSHPEHHIWWCPKAKEFWK